MKLRKILLLAAAPMLINAAEPAAPSLVKAWSAPPTLKIATEEKTFDRNGVTLSGTLSVPQLGGPVPAIVILHGASSPSRNEALYDHLKRMLPPMGVAVFAYDRRGNGNSGGDAKGNSFEVLADDGIAAAQMLANDPRIDPKSIGFWGLSQGGWLSLLAASRFKPTAFAVSVSAPMVTPDVQMNFAVANILRIKGYSQADIDLAVSARKGVDDFMRGRIDRATAQSRLDAAAAKPWFDLIYMSKTFRDPSKSGWAKELQHDPLRSIGAVTAPTLILYGSSDPWVPVAESMIRLADFTREHRNFETAVVAGADHAMSITATPEQQIDPAEFTRQAPDSEEYLGRLAAWLQSHVLTK